MGLFVAFTILRKYLSSQLNRPRSILLFWWLTWIYRVSFTISDTISLSFTMFPCKLNSSQVKRNLMSNIKKLCMRVASWVVKRLKKWWGNLKFKRGHRLAPVSLTEISLLKFSGLVQFCLFSLLFAKYFVFCYRSRFRPFFFLPYVIFYLHKFITINVNELILTVGHSNYYTKPSNTRCT